MVKIQRRPQSVIWFVLVLINFALCQEPNEFTWVSSECATTNNKPQMCYPPFTSAAAERKVTATNTCGEKQRQKYCIHMSTAGMSSRCQYCDSRNPDESHFAEYLTDKNPNNWWQSETMADNRNLHFEDSVNLTLDLGTQFHVNYVYLQFKSPRPHAMVIYKKFADGSDWTPWAYFSSNCYTYFGMNYSPIPVFLTPDQLICYEEYSTLQPLYEGEVIFSVINGRPNYDKFFTDTALQRWSTASQIRVELKKMHTFGDERGAERDTLQTYYFAIQKFSVGGRCLCHGHGNECVTSSGPGQKDRLVCVCDPTHHVTGDNCDQCQPAYRDREWLPAVPDNANPCLPCKCNDNSQLCEYDQHLFETTGSGSRCIGCGNNTHGINCEQCISGYYPNPNQPTTCLPCTCDPIGTIDSQVICGTQGQCTCKPGVGGKRCDRCLPDYFGFSASGCQTCNCTEGGTLDNRGACDPITGQCHCKQNVAGKQCDKCEIGHYGSLSNDPLGCRPCICSLQSSECILDEEQLAITAGKPGEKVELQSLVNTNQIIIHCPEGQVPCMACLQKDRLGVKIDCNGTSDGRLPCLCEKDQNQCPYCPSGWRTPQVDPRTELCRCPPQYTGKSCESCLDGYRRDPPGGLVTDRCILCTCNGHAKKCDPDSGQCECEDNTGGLFCDRCADGYYGNALALAGSPGACKQCPCPMEAKCEEAHWAGRSIEVVCKDCPDNRSGIRCERCADNYYGDPLNGIPCKPCDCTNNVDPREFGNCDGKTGECLKCLFGTTGKHCELCLPGYRRNFKPANETDLSSSSSSRNSLIPARGCSPCSCDPVGTLANYGPEGIGACNPENGQCPCKSGVGGLNCDKCYSGFYVLHAGQGCQPCDCNSIGAVDESCDERTGQCVCRPNVIGRQCDQCVTKHYNMTSVSGCQSCECHLYGAVSGECDPLGKCICKPFAVGRKCQHCKENHYNLEAGCLPCPACYNLVQARVDKLWGMLESIFGPNASSTTSSAAANKDDKDLQKEIEKLNQTITKLYNDVLRNNADHFILDITQYEKLLQMLAQQIEASNSKLKTMLDKAFKCPLAGLDEGLTKLRESIDLNIPKLLRDQVQTLLQNLDKTVQKFQPDQILTEHANETAKLTESLTHQSEELKQNASELAAVFTNANTDLAELKDQMKSTRDNLRKKQNEFQTVAETNKHLTDRIELANDLIQKTRNQIYLARTNVDTLPDTLAQLRQLEGVGSTWAEAQNVSKELKTRLMNLEFVIQPQLHRFNQIFKQLDELKGKTSDQFQLISDKFKELYNLTGRVELAKNISWIALQQAEDRFKKLQSFDEYVVATKKSLPDALKLEIEINERLSKLVMNIQDLRDQAGDEYQAAIRALNRTLELENKLTTLNERFKGNNRKIELHSNQLKELRTRHELEIAPEVNRVGETVNKLTENANQIIDKADSSHQQVAKLSDTTDDLLKRMKILKDKLDEVSGVVDPQQTKKPASPDDAQTRFNKLKSDYDQLNLPQRLRLLKQLDESRTIELNMLNQQLLELRTHYEHIVRIDSLLPSIESGCFYTGKGIEGDEIRK